jgi:pimeloyl-ACP methyl ester carboxylesterase
MRDLTEFQIAVPDAVLDDLRDRLRRARLLDDSPRRMASGMSATLLRELVDAWIALDWRAREEWLNGHPQFVARVGDADIHFAHLRSANPDAPALLVMHGWPHTFALQLALAERLPDVHVVVPSFPGFAFSPAADQPLSERFLAETMHALMADVLGYDRYVTYGEDVSANVSDLIAATHPDAVRGIVATHAHFPTKAERKHLVAPDEVAFFARIAADHDEHGAYGHVQATRPDTLAAALNDSPVGLLAWLAEKLIEWSDRPGAVTRQAILTEATIYWATQSIGTSFRPYYEGADDPAQIPPVEVPAAVFVQRHEADYPESLARDFYRDLRVFERLDEGGHFTAAEVPDSLAERIRRFVVSLD